jgi:hypothetical protein
MRRDSPIWPVSRSVKSTLLLAGCLFLAGCGEGDVRTKLNESFENAKESVSKGVEQAKEAAQKATETAKQATTSVKEVAGLGGKVSLSTNPPVLTNGAYAVFVAPAGERSGALLIQSHSPGKAETFPSVFLRCLTNTTSFNELTGATLACEIFVQSQADGPVWRLAPGDSAMIKVNSIEGKLLKAEIIGATLHETSAEQAISFTGQIEAVIP